MVINHHRDSTKSHEGMRLPGCRLMSRARHAEMCWRDNAAACSRFAIATLQWQDRNSPTGHAIIEDGEDETEGFDSTLFELVFALQCTSSLWFVKFCARCKQKKASRRLFVDAGCRK
jgi:hypothetical protein